MFKSNPIKSHILGIIIIVMISVLIVVPVLVLSNESYSHLEQVQINITYSGRWTAFYDNGNQTRYLNGTGNTIVDLERPSNTVVWNVIAGAQKQDDSHTTLRIVLSTNNGKILSMDYTNGEYASALVTYTFGPVWCTRIIPYYC